MDLLELAVKQLLKEGYCVEDLKEDPVLVFEYAYKIRIWLDKHPKIAKWLLYGEKMSKQLKRYYSVKYGLS